MLRENVEEWSLWNAPPVNAKVHEQIDQEVKNLPVKFDQVLFTILTDQGKEIRLIDQKSNPHQLCRVTTYVLRFCSKIYEPIRKRKGKDLPLFEI